MIKYSIERHAIAYPSKVAAQNGAEHIVSLHIANACDNGTLLAKGAFIDLDAYEAKETVTGFSGVIQKQAANGNWYVEVVTPGDAHLVYVQPFIAEDFTNKFKKESNFYNEAGEYVRAYRLHEGDVFELSAEGFTGTPKAGATVSVVAKKLKVATA